MKLRWWPEERTFVMRWSSHIVVGLTGRDRPSVLWHLRLRWRRLLYRVSIRDTKGQRVQ